MRHMVLAGLVAAAIATPLTGWAQEGAAGAKPAAMLGTVTIPKKVMVDGKPLAAGTYQIRVTADAPPPVVGQSPDGARYVEFLQAGKVVARDVATVVSNADMATMAKARRPGMNAARVEMLKGADYMRVWINRSGSNYLIHLPAAA